VSVCMCNMNGLFAPFFEKVNVTENSSRAPKQTGGKNVTDLLLHMIRATTSN
jgi:hypothetical protein